MTAAAVPTPASMPGAPAPTCAFAQDDIVSLVRRSCIRKLGHGGNHTLGKPRPITPADFRIDVNTRREAAGLPLYPPRTPSVHAQADALEVAAKLLRLTANRALNAQEQSLLRTAHTSLLTRLAAELGSGVTSPTPDPPP